MARALQSWPNSDRAWIAHISALKGMGWNTARIVGDIAQRSNLPLTTAATVVARSEAMLNELAQHVLERRLQDGAAVHDIRREVAAATGLATNVIDGLFEGVEEGIQNVLGVRPGNAVANVAQPNRAAPAPMHGALTPTASLTAAPPSWQPPPLLVPPPPLAPPAYTIPEPAQPESTQDHYNRILFVRMAILVVASLVGGALSSSDEIEGLVKFIVVAGGLGVLGFLLYRGLVSKDRKTRTISWRLFGPTMLAVAVIFWGGLLLYMCAVRPPKDATTWILVVLGILFCGLLSFLGFRTSKRMCTMTDVDWAIERDRSFWDSLFNDSSA